MFMSQAKFQTMSMQNFWGVKEVHYGIVQVVNAKGLSCECSYTKGTASLPPLGRLVVTLANKLYTKNEY